MCASQVLALPTQGLVQSPFFLEVPFVHKTNVVITLALMGTAKHRGPSHSISQQACGLRHSLTHLTEQRMGTWGPDEARVGGYGHTDNLSAA